MATSTNCIWKTLRVLDPYFVLSRNVAVPFSMGEGEALPSPFTILHSPFSKVDISRQNLYTKGRLYLHQKSGRSKPLPY